MGLIAQNQSGFKPVYSVINQLLSITYEIYKWFDDRWNGRGVILNISKAFDRGRPQGLILKLKLNEISGNMVKILNDFLAIKYQGYKWPRFWIDCCMVPQGFYHWPFAVFNLHP